MTINGMTAVSNPLMLLRSSYKKSTEEETVVTSLLLKNNCRVHRVKSQGNYNKGKSLTTENLWSEEHERETTL
jgi:hypothetical protein